MVQGVRQAKAGRLLREDEGDDAEVDPGQEAAEDIELDVGDISLAKDEDVVDDVSNEEAEEEEEQEEEQIDLTGG